MTSNEKIEPPGGASKSGVARWEMSYPIRRTEPGSLATGYAIRWAHGAPYEDDDADVGIKHLYVHFAISVVVGEDGPPGSRPLYMRAGAEHPLDGPVVDIAESGALVTGSVKHDGCTDWQMHDSEHVCDGDGFERFLAAMARARRVAAGIAGAEPPIDPPGTDTERTASELPWRP